MAGGVQDLPPVVGADEQSDALRRRGGWRHPDTPALGGSSLLVFESTLTVRIPAAAWQGSLGFAYVVCADCFRSVPGSLIV